MTEGLEAVTRNALSLALDAASLRQEAIAANIANASVAGYVPRQVNFEAQLDSARRTLSATGRVDAFALSQVRPGLETVRDAQGLPAQVQLDVEAVNMARNAVHYQALLKGLSRHFAVMSMAVGDGRK